MLLAGWWGDKFNRLYLNAVRSPNVKSVSVKVDLLPERRVASIENAWVAPSEVRPGDNVPVKVFLRPYRGEQHRARVQRPDTGGTGQGRTPHRAQRRRDH